MQHIYHFFLLKNLIYFVGLEIIMFLEFMDMVSLYSTITFLVVLFYFFFLFCFVFCCSCFLFCLFSFFVSVFVSYSVVSLVKSKIYTMKHFFLLLSTVVLPLKILSQNFHIFLNVRKWYFLFSLYTKLSLITVVFCFEDFTYFIHSFIICKLYRCKLYLKFLSEI